MMQGDNNAKKIRQLDYYTREEIAIYNSIAAAAKDNYCNKTSVQKALWYRDGVMPMKELRFEVI